MTDAEIEKLKAERDAARVEVARKDAIVEAAATYARDSYAPTASADRARFDDLVAALRAADIFVAAPTAAPVPLCDCETSGCTEYDKHANEKFKDPPCAAALAPAAADAPQLVYCPPGHYEAAKKLVSSLADRTVRAERKTPLDTGPHDGAYRAACAESDEYDAPAPPPKQEDYTYANAGVSDDPSECSLCWSPMSTDDGCEPTAICHHCAHAEVKRLTAQLAASESARETAERALHDCQGALAKYTTVCVDLAAERRAHAATRGECERMRHLLECAVDCQTNRCDHRGIGRPGCSTCDPQLDAALHPASAKGAK